MKNWPNNNWLMILLITTLISGCHREAAKESGAGYYCPMHPTVVSPAQGVCPVCQMDLVPKESSDAAASADATIQSQVKPVSGSVLSSVHTVRGTWGSFPVEMKIDGVVTAEAGRSVNVSTLISGRIEYSAMRFDGQSIRKGQELVRIMSPELAAAQQAHLQTRMPETRERLLRMGMTEAQIAGIESSGKVSHLLSMVSPVDGVLTVSTGQASGSGGTSSSGMNEVAEISSSSDGSTLLTTGMRVSAGQVVATIRTTGATSVRIRIPATGNLPVLPGDTLHLEDGSGNKSIAMALRSAPSDEDGYAVVIARTTVPIAANGTRLMVTMRKSGPEGLWIPRAAAVYLGARWTVFIPSDGRFDARTITVGTITKDLIHVTGGLAASESIAADARFLVDSDRNPEPERP